MEIFQIKTLVVNLTSEYVNNPINKEFDKFLDFTMFSRVFFICEKCCAVNRARKMFIRAEKILKNSCNRKINMKVKAVTVNF